MSRLNVINSILRAQAFGYAQESIDDSPLNDPQALNLELEEISSNLEKLVTIGAQMRTSRGATRTHAIALESIEGFKLPFPPQGFTMRPSPTGYKLTQEAISKQLDIGLKKLMELMVGLLRKLRETLFGVKAKAERGREDLKKIRRTVKEGVRSDGKPDLTVTPQQVSDMIKYVISLDLSGDFFKGASADLRTTRYLPELMSKLDVSTVSFVDNALALRFAYIEQYSKRGSEPLYKPGSQVVEPENLKTIFARGTQVPERIVGQFALLENGAIDLSKVDLALDKHFDRAMATHGVIANALLLIVPILKDVEREVTRIHQTKADSEERSRNLYHVNCAIHAYGQLGRLLAGSLTIPVSDTAPESENDC